MTEHGKMWIPHDDGSNEVLASTYAKDEPKDNGGHIIPLLVAFCLIGTLILVYAIWHAVRYS